MAKLDAAMRRTASNVINKFGATAQIVRIDKGDYDSSEGKRSSAEYVSDVKGVWATYNKSEISDQIQAWDRQFIVAAKDLSRNPKPGDFLLVNNRRYRIDGAAATMSGDQPAIWTLLVKGADA